MEFHRLLLTCTIAVYLFTTFAMAYLVVDRRFKGHFTKDAGDQWVEVGGYGQRYGKSQGKMRLGYQKEIAGLAVDVPTKITYLLKNMHEELVVSHVEIRDLFSDSIKFEAVHRKEIEVDFETLKEHMASEDREEIDWLDQEDPDANVEIYKEANEINFKV